MAYVDFKICIKCGEEKSSSQFHKRGNGIFRSDCKDCVREYGKQYRIKNKEVIKEKKKIYHLEKPHIKRRSHLKKEFNMSLEDYALMLKSQNNCCKICGIDNVNNSQHKHLHIDHDHSTGKIRGLLCSKCNTLLGSCKDNIEILKNAIGYLNESYKSL